MDGGQVATVVLVHGAWQGEWCWRRVAPMLRAAGHEVLTPTLAGLGSRQNELSAELDLATHIAEIVQLLGRGDHRRVVLVGHGYGGMVITGVAARVPARVAQLIYIDAFRPAAGQSLADLLPPERRPPAADPSELAVIAPPFPPEMGIDLPEMQRWVSEHLAPHPLRTLTTPLPSAPAPGTIPWVFIQCTEAVSLPAFAETASACQADATCTYAAIVAGHEVMLTAPEELVATLRKVIRGTAIR